MFLRLFNANGVNGKNNLMKDYKITLLYLEAIQRKGSSTKDIAVYSVLLSGSPTAHLFPTRRDEKGGLKLLWGLGWSSITL